MPEARVFISCGQQKGTGEVEIAKKIAEKLEKLGFEPYIAVEEQTLKGVKENIFRRLSESEYLIFVDFKREKLFEAKNKGFADTGKHRGSLFSHQELALATFLDIEPLAFREKGTKEDDGILKFIQANCIEFEDRAELPDTVAKKIEERKWNPEWRNELILERDEKEFDDVDQVGQIMIKARFYHLKVRNLHDRTTAHDCVAYLEKIRDVSTGKEWVPDLVEFKWKGVKGSRIAIPPKKCRYLDAFHVYHGSPRMVYLGINSFIIDWTGYLQQYTLEGPGNFELAYVVFSENFSSTRAKFGLRIGTSLEDVRFATVS